MVFFSKNGSEITPNFYYIFWYILMSLCYVESLSWFRLQFFDLWPFLKMANFRKIPCTIAHGFFSKNGSKITPNFYYIFWYILMSLCYVESLSWFRLQFFDLWPFLKMANFRKIPCTIAHGFFSKNGSEITPNFYYIFWYILMYLCYVESLSWIWVQFFKLWPFLKIGLFLKNTLYYSPCFFPKNGPAITPNFYYIFWYILMSLCYVESLSWFRLQFFDLWPFFKMANFWKIPCTIAWRPGPFPHARRSSWAGEGPGTSF